MKESETREYFITYGHTRTPECKYGSLDPDMAQQEKPCFKVANCPDNVVCTEDCDVFCNPPKNVCPVPKCRGRRRITCITEPCPELSQAGEWRCPLGKLPVEAKPIFEAEMVEEDGDGECLTFLSEEGLDLSDVSKRITHYKLVSEFHKLKNLKYNPDEDDPQLYYMIFAKKCERLATDIRKGEAKYTHQKPVPQSTVNAKQLPPERKRATNDKRDGRIYALACNAKLTWGEIAVIAGEEFDEELSPGQVSKAAERYQKNTINRSILRA